MYEEKILIKVTQKKKNAAKEIVVLSPTDPHHSDIHRDTPTLIILAQQCWR